ncbi:hypothetical protein DESC_100041 [Desulfosarcina cetonica]|nr:hypothetical protein DESC_100041 [Desulfosarcina cetonica]
MDKEAWIPPKAVQAFLWPTDSNTGNNAHAFIHGDPFRPVTTVSQASPPIFIDK